MFKVSVSDISESLWLRYSSPRLTLAIDYFLVKENIIIKDISNTPQNDNNSFRLYNSYEKFPIRETNNLSNI